MFDIDNKKMASVVSGYHIPVKPEVLTQMQSLMEESEPDIEEIAELISHDVGLSAAILKIINSPFYGMNRRVSEIKQAVMMLGLKTINSLVTALCLKKAFNGNASISLDKFWEDSSDIANAMTFIGSKIKSEIPVDMLYTIGLFVNCGVPLLALKYDDYQDVLLQAEARGLNTIAIEEKRYKTNHAVLGYYLSTSWNLPQEICQIVLRHHDNSYLRDDSDLIAKLAFCALKVAENMVERVRTASNSADWADVELRVLDTLGISDIDYQDLEEDFQEFFT